MYSANFGWEKITNQFKQQSNVLISVAGNSNSSVDQQHRNVHLETQRLHPCCPKVHLDLRLYLCECKSPGNQCHMLLTTDVDKKSMIALAFQRSIIMHEISWDW